VHYYLGCVLKARGEFDDAVESFRTAYLMATGKDEAWKSPALVQVAFTHEAAGNWKEAKKAWKDYIDYAKGKSLVINATSLAEERIEAIDKMMDLDKQYAPVRKLIEEQKKGAD
jgi:tetratricopeptide (TPR) repeat protein